MLVLYLTVRCLLIWSFRLRWPAQHFISAMFWIRNSGGDMKKKFVGPWRIRKSSELWPQKPCVQNMRAAQMNDLPLLSLVCCMLYLNCSTTVHHASITRSQTAQRLKLILYGLTQIAMKILEYSSRSVTCNKLTQLLLLHSLNIPLQVNLERCRDMTILSQGFMLSYLVSYSLFQHWWL